MFVDYYFCLRRVEASIKPPEKIHKSVPDSFGQYAFACRPVRTYEASEKYLWKGVSLG